MNHETNETPASPGKDTPEAAGKENETPSVDVGSQPPQADEGEPSLSPEQARIQELETEVAAVKDKMLRAVADMENLRRRTEREKADTAKFAITKFARDILTVGDNIDRAIKSVDETNSKDPSLDGFMEGVKMIDRELVSVLERHGVSLVNPEGALFNPNLHQAIFEAPKEGVNNGIIIEVIQAGYMIDDRVLRPAMVGVAKNPTQSKAKPSDETAS